MNNLDMLSSIGMGSYTGNITPGKSLGLAETLQKSAGIQSGISAFANMAGSFADYSSLRFNAVQKGIQARQVGIVALEQSNALREKVLSDLSNALTNTSRRGITSDSGSVVMSMEDTLKKSGEDITKIQQNAENQKRVLSAEQKMINRSAKTALMTGFLSGAQGAISSYSAFKGM